MSAMTIDRCGYIVRQYLGYLQIIHKATNARKNVAIQRPRTHRCHIVLKHDHDTLYDFRDAQQWALSILPCWSDSNFTALCAHFTSVGNYFDR